MSEAESKTSKEAMENWQAANAEMLRAERLLTHTLNSLELMQTQRYQDIDRLSFEVEQVLVVLEQINYELSIVIAEIYKERQNNYLQKILGKLQQLLSPLDLGINRLRELNLLIDTPWELTRAYSDKSQMQNNKTKKEVQLQQMLTLRQKEILKNQVELNDLRTKLFIISGNTDATEPNIDQSESSQSEIGTPNIFN